MGEVFITRKGGGGKAATPTIAVTDVGGTWIELEITNTDAAATGATIFVLANYDPTSETDFDLQASQNGYVFAVAQGATVTQLVTGLDPDTSHTVSASAAVIKKLPSSVVTTDTINLDGTGVTAPTVGPITENTFTSTTFNVRNDDTVVPQIIKANITESTTVPSVYPFESSTLAALATGSITVSDLTSGTVYYIHARAFDGEFSSSNVVFGPYTQSGPIVATGGTITNYTLDGVGYRAHTFNSNGTFTVSNASVAPFDQVDYLIIAGGGGGGAGAGNAPGGGGGAGGYRTTNGTQGGLGTLDSKVTVSQTSYSVTIGSGGSGGSGGTKGTNGTNSSVAFPTTITSTGGGGGGQYFDQPTGSTGGSGGGSTFFDLDGGLGTANQGFNGGPTTNSDGGGGGGGAGSLGLNVDSGRSGGNGLANILRDGTSETRAGGGGGAARSARSGIGAGSGGGGDGGQDTGTLTGQNATANTGSGGGGGIITSDGGNGGSGIVIIRYVVQ